MIKKTTLILFIFLSIFLISSVSAADMENESNIIENTPSDTVHIESNDVDMYYKDGTRFVAEIRDSNENPMRNMNVTFNLNGQNYTRQSDEKGEASIALNLNSGKYNITSILNNGFSTNNIINIKTTILSSDIVKIYKNSTQYYAKFLNEKGDDLTDTAVTFNINGVFYTRMTNEMGIARLNINLGQGEYILTASNPVNGEMKSNNITVLPSIVNNRDVVKYYKNSTQYYVTILEKSGETAGSGEDVEFNINGVFYTRQTNISGIAKLNLNLNPGDYIITAQYDGCMVSNKIRILPTLKADDLEMAYKDGSKFRVYLVDGTGQASEYEKITFNINGVFYTRTSDEKGIASLNINLQTGTYIITSQHDGLQISNKIIIYDKLAEEKIKNTTFTYEVKTPNYVNVTCPYVFENSAYTIKSGINGIIRMEKNQLINIQIGSKYYTFSTSYMPEYDATYLGYEYYLLPFDFSPTQQSYKYEELTGNGLIIYRSLNYTHFIYRNNCSSNLEQFGVYIDKNTDKSELIKYIQNGECMAKIQFQTLGFDELGLKYSLSKQYGCTIYDFDYKSYGEITGGNIDSIKFANTNESVIFDYFGRKIVGYLTDEEIITKFNSSNCIEFEKSDLITYGISDKYKGDFDLMHSFALINKKVDEKSVNEWILKENEYRLDAGMTSIYSMFMANLNTAYLSDKLSDELSEEYNVKWSRNSNTVILGGMDWQNTYQHILTPDMGMLITGDNESNIIKFRFANSILLSKIEENSMLPIAEDADVNITSAFDEVFTSLANYKVSVVYYNNTAFICDESGNATFLIDLNTGLVTPLMTKDAFSYKGVTVTRDCGLCSINSMSKNIMQNINNVIFGIDDVLSYISDNIRPITTLAIKGTMVAKGIIGAFIGGGLSVGLSVLGTAIGLQSIGVYIVDNFVEDKDIHTAYDYATFTRPGYMQNVKIYNIPHEDGSVDYLEIPINKDNSLNRDNVKYISEGNVKILTKEETYNYFTEESWDPFNVPKKYWR